MQPPGRLLSVNIAHVQPNPYKTAHVTGIDKRPTPGPIEVRAPGTKDGGAGSGLAGDMIGDHAHHGGDDQAVYAYAREDLDHWERGARPHPDVRVLRREPHDAGHRR